MNTTAMTIILTGGGTGGHITPLLAVATEIKKTNPNCRLVYIGEKGSSFTELTSSHPAIDASHTIWAGKFRRYHGESWIARATDLQTIFLNFRDLFYFLIGTVQSLLLLLRIKPRAVFLKGGFVGVPVGLAAAVCKIPFVTHDSDTMPGLANRIVGRWARLHAVAAEAHTYPYPANDTQQVGVLVEENFYDVSQTQQLEFKEEIQVPSDHRMLLVTGGSSGARRLNEAMTLIADKLLADYKDLVIVHQAGKGKADCYGEFTHNRLKVLEFMRPMYAYTGAADVVVARASANTVAELGVQRKAVIVVASPYLAGGHQLKNAQKLQAAGLAISVPESGEAGTDHVALDAAIRDLLTNDEKRKALANALHEHTPQDAAKQLASILLETATKQKY